MGKKPRNIVLTQLILAVLVLLFLFIINLIYQMFWGAVYYSTAPAEIKYKFIWDVQLISPILFAIFIALSYTILVYSPIGISISKSNLGIREIMTEEEYTYFGMLHDEVFQNIKAKFPNAIKRKIYMFESSDINAFCLNAGFDIAIHRGSTQTFNDEEMKALIAHEYGHSYYRDGFYSTLFLGFEYGAKLMFLWPFISRFHIFQNILGSGSLFSMAWYLVLIFLFASLIIWVFKICLFPFKICLILLCRLMGTDYDTFVSRTAEYSQLLFIQNVIFMFMSKQQEYRADEFACYIGYQYGMESILHIFYEINYQPLFGVLDKVFTEHPITAKRIANVEKFRT